MTGGADPVSVAFDPGLAVQVAYAGSVRAPAFNSAVTRRVEGGISLTLVRLPRTQLPPGPNEPVLLVVRLADRLAAFDARVRAQQLNPAELAVSTPIEARRPERRDSTRVAVTIPLRSGAWLDPTLGTLPIEGGAVVDVSAGGAQLRMRKRVATGSAVELTFALVPGEPLIEVQGVVMGAAAAERGAGFVAHVRFIEVQADGLAQLERFVKSAARAA